MNRLPDAARLHDALLARARGDAIADLGPIAEFLPILMKGRRHWYAQAPGRERRQHYLGVETPALLAAIAAATAAGPAEAPGRAALVEALLAAGLAPAPAGALLAALAAAGVFRLRAVLVGTQAFATYPALLGIALPAELGLTTDIDIAQDPALSAMLDDQIEQPIEAILRAGADPRFAAMPDVPGEWRAPGCALRLFACNRGGRAPRRHLPALRAEGATLRMMDFLLRDPVPAVVLHDAGVVVEVPDPVRYAVHGLMIATRHADPARARKVLAQAAALIPVLAGDRRRALAAAHAEAWARGAAWRAALKGGAAALPEPARAALALVTR